MPRVLVAVGNDIVDDFVKHDVQGEEHLLGELVASREVVDHVGHARDLRQVVVDPDLAGCRQPRLRRNRGSSIHRCDKVLATIRRTIAAYAACAIADRRFAARPRSTGEVDVEDSHRRGPQRSIPAHAPAPRSGVPEGSVKGGPRSLPTLWPGVYRGFPAHDPPASWHVFRHVPSRAPWPSACYPGFARASDGSAAGARLRLAAIPRPGRMAGPARRSTQRLTPRS